jgi:2-methylaconitate cis-trans-isomerase PrpF
MFRREDLPFDKSLWDPLFLHIMGSPDAYDRQFNGLGGGLSSLLKVVVVEKSDCPDVDFDYSFPVVFVLAEDLGLQGNEAVEVIENNGKLMDKLESIRRASGVSMGMVHRAVTLTGGTLLIACGARGHEIKRISGRI